LVDKPKPVGDEKKGDQRLVIPRPAVPMMKKGGRKGKRGGYPALPPMISLQPTMRHTFRFQAGAAATNVAVTAAALIAIPGSIGTAIHTAYNIATTFKLHRVTIWPALSTSSDDVASLEWSNQTHQVKDDIKNMSLPEGQTASKSLVFTPPAGTNASFWSDGSITGQLFLISAPSGSIVDVDMTFSFAAGLTNLSVTYAGSITTGLLYYGYLDGVSSHIFAPVTLLSQF